MIKVVSNRNYNNNNGNNKNNRKAMQLESKTFSDKQ